MYVPAVHIVHVPPSGPVKPSAQMQLLLPANDVAPVSQLMHSPARPTQKRREEFETVHLAPHVWDLRPQAEYHVSGTSQIQAATPVLGWCTCTTLGHSDKTGATKQRSSDTVSVTRQSRKTHWGLELTWEVALGKAVISQQDRQRM